jgi:hypothetical protein
MKKEKFAVIRVFRELWLILDPESLFRRGAETSTRGRVRYPA